MTTIPTDAVQFDDRYLVDPRGSVWSNVGAIPKEIGHMSGNGYRTVSLRIAGKTVRKLVHRLVLEAFAGPACEGQEARHLNGIPTDNRIENLAWGTSKENKDDMRRHGRIATGPRHGWSTNPERVPKGSRHYKAKLSEQDVESARFRRSLGDRLKDIAHDLGVSASTLSVAVSGKTWKHV